MVRAQLRRLGASLAVAALLLGPSPARGDDPPPAAALVDVVAVRATGELPEGDRPAIEPSLAPYAPLLVALSYDRYTPLGGAPGKTIVEGRTATWTELGGRHQATVTFEPRGGKLLLTVELLRTKPGSERSPVRVVAMKVLLADGAAYLVRSVGAFPDGDLVLVIRARRATAP